MYAMTVHSANDMAMAMAEHIGGTASKFAAMMTLKAQQLGMANTRYVNPNGLPDNRQVTTAHDIAILTRAVLHDYPQYYSFFSQQTFTYRGHTMVNTNHLLGKVPGVDGLKTGFTNAAGFNLDASAVRNGHRLIAVVMGSSSGAVRNANVEGLLLTGFDLQDRRDRGEKIASALRRGGGAIRPVHAPAQRSDRLGSGAQHDGRRAIARGPSAKLVGAGGRIPQPPGRPPAYRGGFPTIRQHLR
jgi:D-alanyl-D-alanine carboxypeptidase (penicillin-binding protein 5/6)